MFQEVDFIDLAYAVLLTLGVTQLLKMALRNLLHDDRITKLTPLLAILAASVAVAVLIDLETADVRDAIQATIIVAGFATGVYSGPKNVAEGVKAYMRKER